MAEAYIGEIRLFSMSWAPAGWLPCAGQTLAVQQYPALFSLISNAYGGDGRSTFMLPDLRGRAPVQMGQGPLATYPWAQNGGTSSTTVHGVGVATVTSMNQLPQHTHAATFTGSGDSPFVEPTIKVNVSNDTATSAAPLADGYFAPLKPPGLGAAPLGYTATASNGTTTLNTNTAVASGGGGGGITGGIVALNVVGAPSPLPNSVPFSVTVPAVMPPFVALTHAICFYDGIYPPRP
ncbi:phage tail protein [Massilia endophytica]|uniref:phage tail protein n=1 Tax=Massilia endophytica TaxID=2899220 RepID=UPI001E5B20B7|nr:tail fiber protein [Massilia endophytica]UGQ48212.1 phage tail protein [Massilia endophytica]